MHGSVEILDTRRFREKFNRCLARNPIELWMAAPYITGIPYGRTIPLFARFCQTRECGLNIITGKPGNGNGILSVQEANLIIRRGVNLLIRTQPFLHAKIYQFYFQTGDRAAFVGSANFTMGGFKKNDEIVAFFSQKSDNDGIARQFKRLSDTSMEYHQWKIKEALCQEQKNSG